LFGFVKRHLAEIIYDYLPWIFKYSTGRKIRIILSLLFNCEYGPITGHVKKTIKRTKFNDH